VIELAGETFGGLFPFAPHFVDVGGFPLHVVDEGAGDPILLVHGDPTWGLLWRALVGPLSARHRVIVPDHAGMGKSGAPPGVAGYTLADRIGHLERLVLALDLARVTIVVHDWGGPVGLGVAVSHPERISRVVLTNTWAHASWPGAPFPRLVELVRSDRGERFVLDRNGWIEAALRGTTARPELITEQLLAAYLAPFPTRESRLPLVCWSRDIPVRPGDRSWETMRGVEAALAVLADLPVLIVWGMRDPVLPPSVLELWRCTYPEATVVELPDAGHFLQEDAPDRLLPALAAFLGDAR
jgi:haloalkane dehalogenase